MVLHIEPSGRFGTALAEAVERSGVGLRELAATLDGSYEHLRKMVKRLAYPDKHYLKDICQVLHLDFNEMQDLITQDKLEAKFGKSLHRVMGTRPEIAPFEEVIPHLTQEQRDSFLAQMKAVSRQNRRVRV